MVSPPPPRPCLGPEAPSSLLPIPSRITSEGRRWLDFAIAHGLPPRYAAEKLADALAFSLRCATSDGPLSEARAFLVPTKLAGTSAFQPALRALRASGRPAGLPLRLRRDEATGRVAAFAGDDLLGLVQAKHRWLGPLVAHGAAALLLQVTGAPDRGHTHGCNVALAGLDEAVRRYRRLTAGGVSRQPG